MKHLAGWKLWVFAGVSVVFVAAAFLLQSNPPAEPEPGPKPALEGLGEGVEKGGADLAADTFPGPFFAGEEALVPPADTPGETAGSEEKIVEPVEALPGPEAAGDEPLPVAAEEPVVEGLSDTPVGDDEPAPSEAEAEMVEPGVTAAVEADERFGEASVVEEFIPLPVEVAEVEVTGAGEGREPMPAGGHGRDPRPAGRRIEFALEPVAPPVPAVESVTAEEEAAAGTREALGRTLAVRAAVPQARGGTRVLRGSFGYRVPLVVQQVVPDQIKGGVYVPAHEMYVIAREGHWEVEEVGGELTGVRLTPGEAVSPTAADAAESWYLLPWLLEKLRGSRGDGGQK